MQPLAFAEHYLGHLRSSTCCQLSSGPFDTLIGSCFWRIVSPGALFLRTGSRAAADEQYPTRRRRFEQWPRSAKVPVLAHPQTTELRTLTCYWSSGVGTGCMTCRFQAVTGCIRRFPSSCIFTSLFHIYPIESSFPSNPQPKTTNQLQCRASWTKPRTLWARGVTARRVEPNPAALAWIKAPTTL